MKLLKKSFLLNLCLILVTKCFAQDPLNSVDENFMMENGKIYVVMAVVVVIVLGLFIYLFNLDRKISRLEKTEKK